jgi:uncharacterized protein (TIGR02246 family)
MGLPGLQTSVAPADADAIRALVGELVEAWNAGDGEAYGRPFADECDYVTFNGERVRGRAAIAASHQQLFDTHLKDSRLLVETVDMRSVGKDTILVHMTGNSLLKGQRKPRESRRSIQTLVAVKEHGGWRFAAFHNTRIFIITPFRALLMMIGF